MNREEIAKKIKFDIANDLIVKNKDFIEADLSKVLAEIAAAEKRARREVAEEIQEQLIIDIPVYAYGDSEGGSALALQLNNAEIYCNQIITANSEKGE